MSRLHAWKGYIYAALCVAFIIGLLLSAETFQKCEHERKKNEPYKALQEEVGLGVKAVTRLKLHISCARATASDNDAAIAALSGIAVAVFTLALWVSTHRLWKAGERQLEIAQGQITISKRQAEIMERQGAITESVNRARISVVGIDTAVNHSDTRGSQPLFRFKLKNVGLTPALDCEFCNDGLFRKTSDGIPVFFVRDTEPVARRAGTIGQGVEFSSGWMAFEAAQLPDSATSENTIYLWSLARYRDAFSGDEFRETESCFQISLLGGPGPRLEQLHKIVSWRPAGTQNRST